MNVEYLGITKIVSNQKYVLEKLSTLSSSLYYAKTSRVEAHLIVNQKFTDLKTFVLWHDRMDHPGSMMMRRIIENSKRHPLKNLKILTCDEFSCAACYQGKLITRPSPMKVNIESPQFLECIHEDICGPIHPSSGLFRYFMVLIRLRVQFLDYHIKAIRLDNAGEFTSQAFNYYCLSIGIKVEHFVAHVHTQNALAKSFIKRLQFIARPLLMKSNLPTIV